MSVQEAVPQAPRTVHRHRRTRSNSRLHASYQALVRRLRALVTPLAPSQPGMVISVLSTQPREGASTVAANLATCGASLFDQPTLLIDAHPARPIVHGQFNLAQQPGLTDVLFGEATLESSIHPTGVPHVSVIPSGNLPDDQLCRYSPAKIEELLQALRQTYAFILLDLPPVSELGAGLALAQWSDGALLVLESESTRVSTTQQATELLSSSRVEVLGYILNKRRYYVPEWLYRRL